MLQSTSRVATPRIIIIGANFAGLMAASRLSRHHNVTVIDARSQFQWTPNIHEILSGVKTPAGVMLPFAQCVSRYGHKFVQATVDRIDTSRKTIHTSDGDEFSFDVCLIAAGSQSGTFGVPGVAEYAIALRQVSGAEKIASRLDQLALRKRPATVVVVGGGISGMEAVGEILRRRHAGQQFNVEVVEQAPRLFPQQPEKLALDAQARCASYNVELHTGATVKSVQARSVTLDDDQKLRSDLCIWTAGLELPHFLRESPLNTAGQSWLAVHDSLQSTCCESVFIAGDCASLAQPIRKQAYHAMDMGELAGANMMCFLEGKALVDFKPASMPTLIAFGDITTWLVAGNTVLASPLLAVGKEGVFQAAMARFDSPCQPLNFVGGVAGRANIAARRLLLPQLNPQSIIAGITGSRVLVGK